MLFFPKIEYLMNDPSTPKLKGPVPIPIKPLLNIEVVGWNGTMQNNPISTQAGGCYVTLANSINYVQKMRVQKIPRWSGTGQLRVIPRAGNQLNAFYNRAALKFFYTDIPGLGTIYTADSADVVAHEMGHALLDAQRPDFWNVQALEIWAFHEAYADITAIASMLQYKKVLNYVLEETGGDLKKANCVSKIAEQLGKALYIITKGKRGYSPDFLRSAINNFNYKNPSQLPKNAPENKLCAECHSFGRVFLGTWYDILVAFYENNKKKGLQPPLALRNACNDAFKYILEALRRVPRVVRFHDAIANTMLSVARNNADHCKIMRRIFIQRKILTAKILMLETGRGFVNDEIPSQNMFVQITRAKTIKLADYMEPDAVHAFAVDEMANIELEVPDDTYYELDKHGNITYEISNNEAEVIETARLCVASIQSENQLGPDENTMWETVDNKLERTFIE
jgi:hypothetical protein